MEREIDSETQRENTTGISNKNLLTWGYYSFQYGSVDITYILYLIFSLLVKIKTVNSFKYFTIS